MDSWLGLHMFSVVADTSLRNKLCCLPSCTVTYQGNELYSTTHMNNVLQALRLHVMLNAILLWATVAIVHLVHGFGSHDCWK